MQIGDSVIFTPTAWEEEKSTTPKGGTVKKPRSIVGRIAYIHPQRRYYIVEAKVGDSSIRETLYFEAH